MQGLKNREVFLRDPVATTIPNDGVAKVIEPTTTDEWSVLRYELESFVCDGEYQRGLERVLSAFLENLARPQQPAVWVSGFYGSGKSHFVRVLEYLWRDMGFPDGVRARSLVSLPPDIKAQLTELSRLGKQEGGLWSAAGTLGAGSGAVRLALLAILLRSGRLPEQYPAARFVLWLKQNGYYSAVKADVEARGKVLDIELRNMYVSPFLADALLAAVPGLAGSPAEARTLLKAQYPNVSDISDDDLRSTMADVLALQSTTPGKLPLTLLVFDELQQFIAEDPVRTLQVQDMVEACSARFGSRLLFVATGQSALQATPQLQKLQGRFSVRVTLSDTDVEKVVREVVLRKAPDKVATLRSLLDGASGEIDRHLAGTKIGPRPDDVQDRVADYPLLPVRRRLWERMLRAIDSAGAAGQLRTQLRIVHETTRDVADKPLGTVVPADATYWQLEAEMLQSGVLQRDVATIIRQLDDGTQDGSLRSRLCALIFLISKLPTEGPAATGVRATADTLADLVVEDLTVGSATLRQQVPALLQELVDNATLMLVGDEYRLQTRESAEWETDYQARRARIFADDSRIASDRAMALRNAVGAALKGLSFLQGVSKTARKYDLHFGPDMPPKDTDSVPVWVRDEWSVSERTVREEAQAAGVISPIVFVFLPRLEADELKQALARLGAADETVKTRPTPQTQAGMEARAAMESRVKLETQRVDALAGDIVKNARVYQGGGNEVAGEAFPELVKKAIEASIVRLFPKFGLADYVGWDKVVTRANQGAADALTVLGYGADVDKHPACQEVRTYVGGAGKKGSDVRKHFESASYGWPRDAVDGALLALLAAGFLRASRNGQPVQAKGLTQSQIAGTDFVSEGVTISTLQRIGVRTLAAGMGLSVKNGEEAEAIPRILERLAELAELAGGDPPLPNRPDDTPIRELQALAGNQQFVAVYDKRDQLLAWHKSWSSTADTIQQRLPEWRRLEVLLRHAVGLPVVAAVEPQVRAIRANRGLLDAPNPVTPLTAQLAGALRAAVKDAHGRLTAVRDREVGALEKSDEWSRMKPEDRQRLLITNGLLPVPPVDLSTDEALAASLGATSLQDWEDRIVALPARAAKAREEAARLLEPQAVTVRPRATTLKSADDVEKYVQQLRAELLSHVSAGKPVVIV